MSYKLTVSLTLPRGTKYNKKTGPIPVSTTTAKTCPPSCPFNNKNGCYAESGPVAIHWKKITSGERGVNWKEFCQQVSELPDGQLWRHNQAGDLGGEGEIINERQLALLVKANKNKRGFTFTHKSVIGSNEEKTIKNNRELIRRANKNGFTINVSANNLRDADDKADLNIGPVVSVLPSEVKNKTLFTPKGRKVIVCPATYKDGMDCSKCRLCSIATRSVIIGFPAHGAMKGRVDKVLNKSD
jgi:hypothetical protein